jgi:hypothetical protein
MLSASARAWVATALARRRIGLVGVWLAAAARRFAVTLAARSTARWHRLQVRT